MPEVGRGCRCGHRAYVNLVCLRLEGAADVVIELMLSVPEVGRGCRCGHRAYVNLVCLRWEGAADEVIELM